MFGALVYMGFTQGLNVLLGMFFNPVVNAARGIAVTVQGFVNHFVTNLQTAINPCGIKQITWKFLLGYTYIYEK